MIEMRIARTVFLCLFLSSILTAGQGRGQENRPGARPPTFEDLRTQMVDEDIVAEGVKDPRVIAAMRATPRHEFVPAALRARADDRIDQVLDRWPKARSRPTVRQIPSACLGLVLRRDGLGVEAPSQITAAGLESVYSDALEQARTARTNLRGPGADYLIPFAAKARFLFKMDFAEAEYISRLRSGVKGHFSYRRIAWEIKEKMAKLEPELGRLMHATPPWMEDPLHR